MDFIPGDDLKTRVEKNGQFKPKDAIGIILTIGSALQHMHSQSPPVIHQDVKPANIRITPDGKTMLIDFDLATSLQENQTRPPLSELGLTPGFAAPEQYNNMGSPASDQYGLAATLFYLLTASVIPDGLSRASGTGHLQEYSASHIPLDIYTCLEKALRINPADRYQDIQSFLNALSAISKGNPEKAIVSTKKNTRTPISRSRRVFLILAIIAFISIAVVGGILISGYLNQNTSNPEPAIRITSLATGSSTIEHTKSPVPTLDIPATKPITILPTLTVEIRPTPLGSPSGEYAFVSEDTGIPQIYLAGTGSHESTLLTNVPEGACQPDWSPDGKKIVFVSPCLSRNRLVGKAEPYAKSGLFIISVDQKQITPIPSKPGGDFDPAWSPDGNLIAFTTIRDRFPKIFIYDLTTEESKEISLPGTANKQPAWSPDGSKLAFVSNKNGSLQVWIADKEGNDPRAFSIQKNGAAFTVDWSPDNQSIIYSQTNSYRLVRMETGKTVPSEFVLNPRINYAYNPDFSPDGYWVLFDSNMNGHYRIYRITRDGAGAEPITSADGISYQPVWKPAP